MGILLRRTPSPSRRANSTNNQSNPNSTPANSTRSSSSSTRKVSKSRKTRSRSTSPLPRNSYYIDNSFRQRQPVVIMVPNSLLPVSAYFPRDYEFEDEGYDSSSSSTSEASVSPPPALGWRPTQGTLEMEFMFGDMDEEFMQELTRESTPNSDDEEMMEVDTNAFGSSEESTPLYESDASEDRSGHDRQDQMGGRVVDEDYD